MARSKKAIRLLSESNATRFPPYIESLNVSIQFIELQLEEMYAAVDDVQEMTDPSIS